MVTHQALQEEIFAPVSAANPRNSEASAIELKDGRILLAWSDFYGGHSDFSRARVSARLSADGGRTWGEKFTLQDREVTMNVTSPAFARLNSGAIFFTYSDMQNLGDVRQYVCKSYDEGYTWTESRCVTTQPAYQFVTNDRALMMTSGRIVLPISYAPAWHDGASFVDVCYFSDDEGETWQRGKGEIPFSGRGAMEPVCVERRDGSLLMAIRTQAGDQYRAESYDGGDTWTDPRPMGLVSSEAPANIRRIPSTGDLLIVWNHVFDPARQHFGRTPLTAAISRDDGDTWENFRDLETEPDHSYAYPSILFRADEVLLTYYRSRERTTGWELKLKILPVSWFYD